MQSFFIPPKSSPSSYTELNLTKWVFPGAGASFAQNYRNNVKEGSLNPESTYISDWRPTYWVEIDMQPCEVIATSTTALLFLTKFRKSLLKQLTYNQISRIEIIITHS